MMEDKVDSSRIVEIGESTGVFIYAHHNRNNSVYRLNGLYAEAVNQLHHSSKQLSQRELSDALNIDVKTCRRIWRNLIDLKIVLASERKNGSNQKVRVISLNPIFHFHSSNALVIFKNFVEW